ETLVRRALGGRRGIDDLGRSLRGVRDVRVADLHRDGAEVTGTRGVGVADRALGGLDRVDDPRRAVAGLAARGGPVARRLVRPRALAGCGEVLGEVLGRARLVGTVDGDDREVGELDALVLRGDRRVVPLRDLAVEDLGDRLRVEVDVRRRDLRKVVDD